MTAKLPLFDDRIAVRVFIDRHPCNGLKNLRVSIPVIDAGAWAGHVDDVSKVIGEFDAIVWPDAVFEQRGAVGVEHA